MGKSKKVKVLDIFKKYHCDINPEWIISAEEWEKKYGHIKQQVELGKAYKLLRSIYGRLILMDWIGAMEGREDVTEDDMFASWCIFMLLFESEKSCLDIDAVLGYFGCEALRDKYLK